ncbi:PucR family transcriptional regulator [Pseudonocardia acaciae]|uniref:PucR family transcriptional regulator n=1 Tax=Pseudonocardia acaciae TaxID=551276 RepID=UPI001B80C85B|nr:PucR family transcriptional regulator [Pseudonocardia acaciae]
MPRQGGYTLTVGDVLALPSVSGARLLAGRGGLDRIVQSVNVMEVPDILAWVKRHELLLTTGFPLRHGRAGELLDDAALCDLIDGLAARGVTALAVKAGRYLREPPDTMLGAAEKRDFPLLLLPAAVSFDDVISQVFTQLVDRQSSALDIADRLHRALTAIVLEGGDLPQIAEEFATLFDVDVLICTPDGRVQTVAGDAEALHQLPLFDPTGRFLTERVTTGLQPAPEGRPGQVALARIVAGGTDHGRVVAYGRHAELSPVTVQALERAATVAALAITKQLAVAAVESKYRGDFLRDALLGTAGGPERVAEHCGQLGWDVDRPLVVIVARLDDTDPDGTRPAKAAWNSRDRLTAGWQQVVRARDKTAPVVGFSHEVVTLMPATEDTAIAVVDEIIRAVRGDRGGGRRSFSTGVSRPIRSVADLPAAYDQARRAVTVGRRMHGPGGVAHFDSLGVHRLISLVTDNDELRSFAAEALGPLAADTGEAADMRRTLQTLLDHSCSVAEAARALHFHYNTLRYRIGKLEGLVGPFTTDPELRLNVALALRVVRMRGLGNAPPA